jgi:hypothetical protein
MIAYSYTSFNEKLQFIISSTTLGTYLSLKVLTSFIKFI